MILDQRWLYCVVCVLGVSSMRARYGRVLEIESKGNGRGAQRGLIIIITIRW